MVVSKTANSANSFITIKAHGCQKDLSDIPGLSALYVQDQVSLALEYIQKSSVCNGFVLPEGESIKAFVPHVSGLYNDLSNDGHDNNNLVFFATCQILGVPGARCSECNKLFQIQNVKRQRKERRILERQIRERVLQDRWMTRITRISHRCYRTLPKKRYQTRWHVHVIWKQQMKIMQTKTNHGYRWHPK